VCDIDTARICIILCKNASDYVSCIGRRRRLRWTCKFPQVDDEYKLRRPNNNIVFSHMIAYSKETCPQTHCFFLHPPLVFPPQRAAASSPESQSSEYACTYYTIYCCMRNGFCFRLKTSLSISIYMLFLYMCIVSFGIFSPLPI